MGEQGGKLCLLGTLRKLPLLAGHKHSRTHLRGHEGAIATTLYTGAVERQPQANMPVSQAAAKVRDHQPGAAICREVAAKLSGMVCTYS